MVLSRDDGAHHPAWNGPSRTRPAAAGRWEFTSESVTEGHPDKVCDQIADAVLDAIYTEDPQARVACEVAATTGLILLFGEVTTSARIDYAKVARQAVLDIGYSRAEYGLDGQTCAVLTSIHEQSPDIAQGVDAALELREAATAEAGDPYDRLGAGDQGMAFGFACRETEELMPLPVVLAHRLAERLAFVRKSGILPYLRPDGKTQVTVAYEGWRPVAVTRVVVAAQHEPTVGLETLRRDEEQHVIRFVIGPELLTPSTRMFINPTGRFVIGGPHGDSGMTGRKIIVDTYGGMGRHGGGSFSGKDPTKVDRSGAYAARHVAKNVVASGLADRCEVQIGYVIGVARPVSFWLDTQGTGHLPDVALTRLVQGLVDLRPGAIIDRFALRRPIYRPLAAYGHFGRPELDLPWERTDLVAALQDAALAEGWRPPARAEAAASSVTEDREGGR